MPTKPVARSRACVTPLSPLSKIANRLQARQIIDRLCRDVVDNPNDWRERAIDSIATALDVVERRQ
jgi:hypothetical protein